MMQREQARPFVGRARELGELRLALSDTAAGHGSLLLVSGEPGIGKTRLMEELAHHAAGLEWRVFTGRCWDGGGAPAYWPWIQVVRAAGGEFELLAPTPQIGREASDRHRDIAVSDSVDPEAARFQLFDEVGRFLANAAQERPCLIVLDDLHAADEPSLLLLRFLATSAAERPYLVLGSYREGEARVHALAELFGDLARIGRRIPLRGLSSEEVAEYMALVSGGPPSQAVVSRVTDVTAGNPFFVGEVIRALVADGRLASADPVGLRLPEEVRALIRRRVAGLSPEAISTLRVAAVVGRSFDLRVIQPTTSLSPERVVDVLAETVRSGVTVEVRDVPGSYAFAHDLVRETLYEDLLPARRMQLHQTVGAVLEDLFREDLEPHLAEIAHHLYQAAPLGDSDRALDYSVRAADRARSVLAYEDAARHYVRALQLLGSTNQAPERHAELLLALGGAQARAGDEDDARRSFEDAAAIARRGGATDALAQAALGYVTGVGPARTGLGGLLLTARFEAGSKGISLLEQALDVLPSVDSPLRARVLARLATELYPTERREQRLALSQEAIDMALRAGDAEALVDALHGRHWATLAPDSVHERLSNAQHMLVAATGAGNEEAAFLARHARLHCFLELCDVGGLDSELEAMARLAGRIRQPFHAWHAASLRGMRSMLEGRLADAEREVRAALEIGRVRENATVSYMFEYAQLVAIRWAQGRLSEVRKQIDDHGERFRGIPRWRDALAAAELGDERAARAEVERHAQDGFERLPRDGLWLLHLCALAQACVLIRDRRRAILLYDLLTPFADRNAISVSTVPFGPVAMRLGMLATLLERWEEAEEQFVGAEERCDAMGARALKARVLLEHGAMLAARDGAVDRGRSVELLAQASATAHELDLPGIRDQVSAIGGPKGWSTGSVGAASSPTFRREGQYWTIAYEGELARLRDLKGLAYIAALLASPGRAVHVVELVGLSANTTIEAVPEAEELRSSRLDGVDSVLDAQAKESYRRRLADLAEEREEARSWNDSERLARVQLEIDALTSELGRALGLGGRSRGMPSPADRARVSVTKAIRSAVRTISEECPRLGEHLGQSIRTGRFCSYAPLGREPPTWTL